MTRGQPPAAASASGDDALTVGEFLGVWLDGKQRLRASTTVAYRIHVERHIVPCPRRSVAELSLEDLRAFYAGLRDQGLSAASVQRVHATLSSALNAAVRRGLLSSSPTAWVELATAVAIGTPGLVVHRGAAVPGRDPWRQLRAGVPAAAASRGWALATMSRPSTCEPLARAATAVLDDPATKPWRVNGTTLSEVLHRKVPHTLVLHYRWVRSSMPAMGGPVLEGKKALLGPST